MTIWLGNSKFSYKSNSSSNSRSKYMLSDASILAFVAFNKPFSLLTILPTTLISFDFVISSELISFANTSFPSKYFLK